VVRDEIRRTLIEELQMLNAESKRATDALQKIRRAASLRGTLWSLLMAVLSTGIPIVRLALDHAFGPRNRRIARAPRRAGRRRCGPGAPSGGRIEWRHCGATARLCVRVDRRAPTYGEKADLLRRGRLLNRGWSAHGRLDRIERYAVPVAAALMRGWPECWALLRRKPRDTYKRGALLLDGRAAQWLTASRRSIRPRGLDAGRSRRCRSG
jgi:hypothetical protein